MSKLYLQSCKLIGAHLERNLLSIYHSEKCLEHSYRDERDETHIQNTLRNLRKSYVIRERARIVTLSMFHLQFSLTTTRSFNAANTKPSLKFSSTLTL
jgi:hypothetical protein